MVFTLPEELASLALRNQEIVYALLFRAASQSLLELGRDRKYLGAQIGFTALLHTWSQTLTYHPHLHCIVPGGGLSPDGHRWITSRNNFLVPVKVLAALFRGKMMAYLSLRQAYETAELIFPGRIAPWRERHAFDQLCRDLYGKDSTNCVAICTARIGWSIASHPFLSPQRPWTISPAIPTAWR